MASLSVASILKQVKTSLLADAIDPKLAAHERHAAAHILLDLIQREHAHTFYDPSEVK